MTAEFLPFFPIAIKPLIALGVDALRPAPFAYLLREIEAGADVRVTLEECAALPAEFIRTLGGDRFAPAFHIVEAAP
jgi:hypothetical protein